jgi:hypothetical protein
MVLTSDLERKATESFTRWLCGCKGGGIEQIDHSIPEIVVSQYRQGTKFPRYFIPPPKASVLSQQIHLLNLVKFSCLKLIEIYST